MTTRAVVLLSGGMDSATALWAAIKQPDIEVTSVITVNYDQHGSHLENIAARNLVTYAHTNLKLPVRIIFRQVVLNWLWDAAPKSGLTAPDLGGTDRDRFHKGTKLPYTYVPARNLILLSLAAGAAFDDLAQYIVGGWVLPDSPYPDCRTAFLSQAENAINFALGTDKPNVNARGWVSIFAPVLHMSKQEVVEYGSQLGVPWELTRSCYQQSSDPCMKCDSCIKRMEAFVDVGLVDPLVRSATTWKRFRRAYLKGEANDRVS